MNRRKLLIGLALIVGVALWSPAALWAGEHGGKEHAGAEQGGAPMEESQGVTEDRAATLQEAARILRQEGYDELADKLEEIAGMQAV